MPAYFNTKSHSSKDKAFVEELVELLESIGFDENNLFCSSVDGYGIGLGEDISGKNTSFNLISTLHISAIALVFSNAFGIS